jgi:hypothetical protein
MRAVADDGAGRPRALGGNPSTESNVDLSLWTRPAPSGYRDVLLSVTEKNHSPEDPDGVPDFVEAGSPTGGEESRTRDRRWSSTMICTAARLAVGVTIFATVRP